MILTRSPDRQVGDACLGNDAARPVLEADGDLVAFAGFHALLDFVAGHHSAHRADHGRDVLPAPVSDLVAEKAAYDRAADCAEAGSFALRFDLAHRLHHAAFGAPPSCGCAIGHLRRGLRPRPCRITRVHSRILFGPLPGLFPSLLM